MSASIFQSITDARFFLAGDGPGKLEQVESPVLMHRSTRREAIMQLLASQEWSALETDATQI